MPSTWTVGWADNTAHFPLNTQHLEQVLNNEGQDGFYKIMRTSCDSHTNPVLLGPTLRVDTEGRPLLRNYETGRKALSLKLTYQGALLEAAIGFVLAPAGNVEIAWETALLPLPSPMCREMEVMKPA